MSWQKCPVCEGRGNVPQGFYARQPSLPTTAPLLEPCRSCDGKGVLLTASVPTEPFTLMKFGPGVYPPATLPGFDKSQPWTGDELPPLPWTHDYAEPVP